MRWTVLMSDLMMFFPAVLYFVMVYYSGKPSGDSNSVAWHTMMILLNPCVILIDHGHFQVSNEMYNDFCHMCHLWFISVCPFFLSFLVWPLSSNLSIFSRQYNCISLGLTTAAVAAILSDRDLVGSMLFCLALNHKQVFVLNVQEKHHSFLSMMSDFISINQTLLCNGIISFSKPDLSQLLDQLE